MTALFYVRPARTYSNGCNSPDVYKRQLRNLESNYTLLKKMRPIFASERSKGVKYKLNDNFLQFWFRFIYPCLLYTSYWQHII